MTEEIYNWILEGMILSVAGEAIDLLEDPLSTLDTQFKPEDREFFLEYAQDYFGIKIPREKHRILRTPRDYFNYILESGDVESVISHYLMEIDSSEGHAEYDKYKGILKR